jgi:hypothetical protein
MKMDVHSNDPEALTTGYQSAANAGFFDGRRFAGVQIYRLKN